MKKRIITSALSAAILLLAACSSDTPDNITIPQTDTEIMRGKELAEGLASCGFCHGVTPSAASPLAGGREVYDVLGSLTAPNITGHATGIKDMTDLEIVDSLRGKWRHEDGSPDIHNGYQWMSNADTFSIVSYLRSVKPVNHEVELRSLSSITKNTTGLFEGTSYVSGYVPGISKSKPLYYGKYLVDHVARCGSCHSPQVTSPNSDDYLSGKEIETALGTERAPSLRRKNGEEGRYWSEQNFITYLQSGKKPNNTVVNPELCPVGFYKNADVDDLVAIAQYLRSLS